MATTSRRTLRALGKPRHDRQLARPILKWFGRRTAIARTRRYVVLGMRSTSHLGTGPNFDVTHRAGLAAHNDVVPKLG